MMGGMSGGMGGDMASDMKRMKRMSGDQMKAMVPMHRTMVATMLSQMNTQMGQIHMTGDAAWTATVDSLRQDLVRMPDLSAGDLKAMMPAHMARITGLEEMHGRMTTGMKK